MFQKSQQRQVSITKRLSLTLTFLIGTVTVAISGISTVNQLIINENELQKSSERLADDYSLILESPVWSINSPTITSIGIALSHYKNVAQIKVALPDKRVLYEYSSSMYSTEDRNLISYSRLIFHESQIIGILELKVSKESLHKTAETLVISALIYAILILTITFLSIKVIVGYLLREPLRRLNKIMKEFSDSNYEFSTQNIPIEEFAPFEAVLNQMGQKNFLQLKELRSLYDLVNAKSEEIGALNANLEATVHQRTLELQNTNRELESFSYSISHDLRAPLRHIAGFVQLLEKKFMSTLPEQARHYLETITNSTNKMGLLIDDLLHLSKTGRTKMNFSPVDMNRVLEDALDVLKNEYEQLEISWSIRHLPTVNGDYLLLRQVWTNLVGNSIKYSKKMPRVTIDISIRQEVDYDIFSIKDNGVGFDQHYSDKLFGVFQRLHSDDEFEGNGIGLAIVQKIIKRHGGSIWATSEKGKGALFEFSLPSVQGGQ